MAAKILALFALLAVSVSADAASKSYYSQYLTPSTTAVAGISIPCVQYATLEQVLASGAISPSSAIALEGPLAVLRQQCLTDILQQGATTLPGQQQAPSVAQQQIIVQQQLLPFLQQQALLIQQLQQQQQQVQQQQQQAVLLPYLSNDILATANPAGFYGYGQQQQLPYLFDAVNAINPAASYYGQEQLFPSTLNAFSAVNPAAAYEQQQLFSYLLNTLAATNPAAFRQPFSAGARF